MTRRDRRRSRALARGNRQASTPQATPQTRLSTTFGCADRRSLLLGTALASTLLLGVVIAPAPALAAAECTVGGVDVALPPPTTSINIAAIQPIVCVNGDTRIATGAFPDYAAIGLYTVGIGATITLTNDGSLKSSGGVFAFGLHATTAYDDSDIDIHNRGDIQVKNTLYGYGIRAVASASNSPITITNSGEIGVKATDHADGIFAYGYYSPITVTNTGDMTVESAIDSADGIDAYTYGDFAAVSVTNSGDFDITSNDDNGNGISIDTDGYESAVIVNNTGDMSVRAVAASDGIDIETYGPLSPISVTNSGNLTVTSSEYGAEGIDAGSFNYRSAVSVMNSGNITAKGFYYANGINAYSLGNNSPVSVTNRGNIKVEANYSARGIVGFTYGDNSPLSINNSGDISVAANERQRRGYRLFTANAFGPITIVNSGSALRQRLHFSAGIVACRRLCQQHHEDHQYGRHLVVFRSGNPGYLRKGAYLQRGHDHGLRGAHGPGRPLHQPGGRRVRGAEDELFRCLRARRQRPVRESGGRHGAGGKQRRQEGDERLREAGDLQEPGPDLDGRRRHRRYLHHLQHAGRHGPELRRLRRLDTGGRCLPGRAGLQGG